MRSRVLAAIVVAFVSVGIGAGVASADTPIGACVPTAGGAAITTPTSGTSCGSGATYKQLASQADFAAAKARIAALETLLTGVTRSVVNGRQTLRISGENVQVVNGSGSESTTNGLGNLIVGYNDSGSNQPGSHNLILGRYQTATSWGSILGGQSNQSTGPLQIVMGDANRATANFASVLGGHGNLASSRLSTVTGGCENTTGTASNTTDSYCTDAAQSGQMQSVTGGAQNVASGTAATITGGLKGLASGGRASITGGYQNTAGTRLSSIVGGCENSVGGFRSTDIECTSPGSEGDFQAILGGQYGIAGNVATSATISGGSDNQVTGVAASVVAGFQNLASGGYSSVSGGGCNVAGSEEPDLSPTCNPNADGAPNLLQSVAGGALNSSSGHAAQVAGGFNGSSTNNYSSVLGGFSGTASGKDSALLGGAGKEAAGTYETIPAIP